MILEGSVERLVGVPFTFEAQDGTAGEGCISSASIFVAVYPTAFVWQMDT